MDGKTPEPSSNGGLVSDARMHGLIELNVVHKLPSVGWPGAWAAFGFSRALKGSLQGSQ